MGRQVAALPDWAPVAKLSAPKGAATPPGACHPLETQPKGDGFHANWINPTNGLGC